MRVSLTNEYNTFVFNGLYGVSVKKATTDSHAGGCYRMDGKGIIQRPLFLVRWLSDPYGQS